MLADLAFCGWLCQSTWLFLFRQYTENICFFSKFSAGGLCDWGILLVISLEFQGNKASTVFYDTALRIWFYSGFSFAKAGQKSFIPDSSELGHMASKKVLQKLILRR
ncbi:hypothetical protein [uncultured Bilophila sp.]|uniref:hypothetical protein n=1 Tax=uncultured Bilophila sp. TaxID=529385 RepID=UPI00280A5334|nr:hypothetical protein [uncultured Bilophila sp.]